MRAPELLREMWATTWASKVSSALMAIVVATMCFAALTTVGRAVAAAADITQRMEQAGARRLSVVDNRQEGFVNPRTLAVVRQLSTVETANAIGVPFDVVNGHVGRGGIRVAAWPVLGDLTTTATLIRGRWPQPGEAIVSTTQLGKLSFGDPVGYLTTPDGLEQYPVVGSFASKAPFEDLGAGVIVAATAGDPGRELRVVITSVDAARSTVRSVMAVLAPTQVEGVAVESPTAIAETARDIASQQASYGRSLLVLILAVGGVFVAAVALADVLIRRRDLGRRRTLGITRADLTVLVTGRTLITSLAGAILGCLTGWLVNTSGGQPTPLAFAAAVGILATVAAVTSALPPAIYATRLDPVEVLRTP